MRLLIFLFIILIVENQAQAVSIAIAGDSMACRFYPPSTAEGWGMEINDVLSSTVNNFAASGSSTKSFFYGSLAVDGIPAGQPNSIHRWANLLASHPDYVFISFGWIDKGASNDPERYCTLAEYQANLGRMIDEARGIGATPLLLTSPTGRYYNADGSVYNNIRDYCDTMIQVAQSKSAAVIDLNSSLLNLYQAFGPTSVQLFGYLPTDGLHFGEYGATQVAHLIANDIPLVLPSLASSLIPGGNQLALSGGGATLTLNPALESTIKAPVLLQTDLIINGTGIIHFNGGIQGTNSLTLQAGTITASGLAVDSLTIGIYSAVPEPSSIFLLCISLVVVVLYCLSRNEK
ncbi:MAG: PEP-CTERM sorting domain-containing protein [Pirellulales bacterium]|nr:PEP-CTERM sorting domain-containing protein [Pirellulales bacterium]